MRDWGELSPVIQGREGVTVEVGVPMSRLTSLRVGGPLDLLIRVADEKALTGVLAILKRMGCPWFALGAGTNLLVTDEGIEGAALALLGDFRDTRIEQSGEDMSVLCGAGTGLNRLLVDVDTAGMSGLEFLHGIPGTVGGAVTMNAGTLHGWVESALVEARLATAEGLQWVGAESLQFGYRHSEIPADSVVASARFGLAPGKTEEQRAIEKDLKRRREGQPPMEGTAGSFFKNPDPDVGLFAGRLIEEAGMKGVKHGGAYASTVHANFVTNGGDATASEILELACRVREEVLKQRGVEMEPEVRIVGRNSETWWARLGVRTHDRRRTTGPMEILS